MANLCEFTMMVRGKADAVKKFYDALTQKTSDAWIGTGGDAELKTENEDGDTCGYIDGWCRWSVKHSMFIFAKTMQQQKENGGKGSWHWDEKISAVKEFPTLFEACKKYGVNMEVFSYDPMQCFSEHYKWENGKSKAEKCFYQEVLDEETGLYGEIGGFEPDFDLAEVL